jgi:hypothetical protein
MTEENKKRTQREWIKAVVLTPEQYAELISKKTARNLAYSESIKRSPIKEPA